ncbi:hypothetical protein CROQUDRAFT_661068 [Cronartium quercuum f. sp. fusiforme G11]|uniref:Uncharacterized protein n=1 Tax=Cronartium quercuum f. sp. fusiforme G11 TaxID=708437 RepID=A0A9P6TAF6_9BASI|nr:hypothetical protein CROQUDRAFT_661068 [Cronartium quercuum f. sp. fusiforme G11]
MSFVYRLPALSFDRLLYCVVNLEPGANNAKKFVVIYRVLLEKMTLSSWRSNEASAQVKTDGLRSYNLTRPILR